MATLAGNGDSVELWATSNGAKQRMIGTSSDDAFDHEIALSTDGRRLAQLRCGLPKNSKRQAVTVWDTRTGRQLVSFGRAVDRFGAIAFSQDGKTLGVCTQRNVVEVRSSDTGKLIKVLRYDNDSIPITIVFSKDGRRIAAMGPWWLRVWELPAGRLVISADAKLGSSKEALAAHKKALAAYKRSKNSPIGRFIKGWPPSRESFIDQDRWTWNNLGTGKKSGFIIDRVADSRSGGISVSPDMGRVAIWRDRRVRILDTNSGLMVREIRRDAGAESRVAFSPDGKSVALETKQYENVIRVVDIATGRFIASFRGHGSMARDLVFSADGRRLLATTDYRLYIWNVKTRLLLPYLKGHEAVINAVVSPDGRFIASEGVAQGDGRDPTRKFFAPTTGDGIRLWDARTGKQLFNFGPGRDANFTADAKSLLFHTNDGKLHFRDLRSGKTVKTIRLKARNRQAEKITPPGAGPSVNIFDLRLFPDGQRVAYLVGQWQIAIRSLGTNVTRFLTPDPAADRLLQSLSISKDGKSFLCTFVRMPGWYSGFAIFSSATGKLKRAYTLKDRITYDAEFSPDGKLVAVAIDGKKEREVEIRLVDAATGRLNKSLSYEYRGRSLTETAVSFSPDGSLLAVAGRDSRIRVFNVKTGRKFRELVGHRGGVNSVSFSNRGSRLISSSDDSTVLVWDMRAPSRGPKSVSDRKPRPRLIFDNQNRPAKCRDWPASIRIGGDSQHFAANSAERGRWITVLG
ncbi:MAG: WD40 repeat domain-containing protein [Planctomycetaceae bacterium]